MAKKKVVPQNPKENESLPMIQPITEILEKNYMPYAMSVIISRALPEIDGFKPSHRKLLYTMYNLGLMSGAKMKSAKIVGATMSLNPHGDSSIYETMVRLTRGHEALLHPFIDSKGNFGKHYSRDMAYAASRYTEAKLEPFCQEIFSGIDKNAVDFVPNYDNSTTEPTLFPTTFPNILISPNLGIAVGMACSICSFNLAEICDGTIALLKNPKTTIERLLDIIKGPDFSTGAEVLYDRAKMERIYEFGTGSIKMRASYAVDRKEHRIDIIEIPYSASIEAIINKTRDMIKSGKLKEITDVRDSVDLSSSRLIVLDYKKDADPDLIMTKLFSATELETTFDCNFNILINGSPRTLGVRDILLEWIEFRKQCFSRELAFDLKKKEDKLDLLKGLAKILVDIDKAIRIIRTTEKECDVVPNLSQAFSLSERQAEYVADIKLRHINREYIINRVKEIEQLEEDIRDIKETLRDEIKLKAILISQLQQIKKKYGKARKTKIVEVEETARTTVDKTLFIDQYTCRLVLTRGGYFKKLSLQAARSADEHKLKEGDYIIYEEEASNLDFVLFFTDKGQIYREDIHTFDLCKASQMGDYIPAKLSMDDDEHVIACKMFHEINPDDKMVYIFENGKGVRIPMSAYITKSKRRKLTNAFSTESLPVGAFYESKNPIQIFLRTDNGKGMLIKSNLIIDKTTRTSAGKQIFQLTRKAKVEMATDQIERLGEDALQCRKLALPSTGVNISKMKFNF